MSIIKILPQQRAPVEYVEVNTEPTGAWCFLTVTPEMFRGPLEA